LAAGINYEIFVQNLYQALLDSESKGLQKNIKIERNKLILDKNGINREFDLYWEYELAGITYKTVIECKDYASPITVEKIDALIGKISDIPYLKPVFATKTGYQSGAKTKAKGNNIELLIVREQNDDDWEGRIREIGINLIALRPCNILEFIPTVEKESFNTCFNIDKGLPSISGQNNEIFIYDVFNCDKYSLYDLQSRLNAKSNGSTEIQTYCETFEDAYLIHHDLKLKLTSYTVKFVEQKTIKTKIEIDGRKYLIGVIEYLQNGKRLLFLKII